MRILELTWQLTVVNFGHVATTVQANVTGTDLGACRNPEKAWCRARLSSGVDGGRRSCRGQTGRSIHFRRYSPSSFFEAAET
jgi:hypothetical protein